MTMKLTVKMYFLSKANSESNSSTRVMGGIGENGENGEISILPSKQSPSLKSDSSPSLKSGIPASGIKNIATSLHLFGPEEISDLTPAQDFR